VYTPVEDVRQATTEAAWGGANHLLAHGTKFWDEDKMEDRRCESRGMAAGAGCGS
jgi:hypothetical protein